MKKKQHTFWAMMCHLSSLLGFFLPGFSIIGPLIVWGFKRHEDPLVMKNGRNVINFILSFWLYAFGLLAIFALFGILVMVPGSMAFEKLMFPGHTYVSFVFFFYGACCLVYLFIYGFFHIVLPIYGGIKALNGEVYRYPFTLTLLKETETSPPRKTKKAK